jgi:hypothetical protein
MPSVGARRRIFAHPQRPNVAAANTGSSAPAKVVGASEFGGPGDPSSGTHGYRGDDLRGKMAFAELGMGTALGGLPYRAKLQITYNGRSVIAEKLDIGRGGSPVQGHPRAIDLWYETARALGFSGLGLVSIQDAGGKGLSATGSASPGAGGGGGGTSLGIGDLLAVLFDPTKAAKLAIDVLALMFRWSAKAFWQWVVAPPWHASQRAVDYYARVEMNQGNRALVTMAFWSLGYAILHADIEGKQMSGARPSKTPLGRTIGSAKRLIKRPTLTSPKKTGKKTSTKPTPTESTTRLDKIRVVSATRTRRVKVTDRTSSDTRTGNRKDAPLHGARTSTRHAREGDRESAKQAAEQAAANGKAGVGSQGNGRRDASRHSGEVPEGLSG